MCSCTYLAASSPARPSSLAMPEICLNFLSAGSVSSAMLLSFALWLRLAGEVPAMTPRTWVGANGHLTSCLVRICLLTHPFYRIFPGGEGYALADFPLDRS